jgi:hypothetical protein
MRAGITSLLAFFELIHSGRQAAGRWAGGQAGGQAGRQAGRQAGKHADP